MRQMIQHGTLLTMNCIRVIYIITLSNFIAALPAPRQVGFGLLGSRLTNGRVQICA